MSNKHNYSQYSNRKNEKPVAPKVEGKVDPEIKPVATPEVKMEPIVPVEPVMPILAEEAVDTVAIPKTVSGVVANCSKLNVRAEASMFADVICVLDVDTEIKVDVTQSNHEWFKIYTAIGAEGYCMRKFVNAHM